MNLFESLEAGIELPEGMKAAVLQRIEQQDELRGGGPSPREAQQGQPPWPDEDDPILAFILHRAEASIDAGLEVSAALLRAVVSAWVEGGIENYDRGRRDGAGAREAE